MLNVDATFRSEDLQGAVTSILGDDKGSFIAASNDYIEHVANATMAEAYAPRRGLLLAQQLGIENLIVESDCMEVIDTMHDGGFSST